MERYNAEFIVETFVESFSNFNDDPKTTLNAVVAEIMTVLMTSLIKIENSNVLINDNNTLRFPRKQNLSCSIQMVEPERLLFRIPSS